MSREQRERFERIKQNIRRRRGGSASEEPKTAKEKVLDMLRKAGKTGVHSNTFFEARMPRAAARIYDLRQEGYDIRTVHEGDFARYTLYEDD